MKLSEDYSAGSNIIRAYQENRIDINGKLFEKSLVVSNTRLIENWPLRQIDELQGQHLASLLEMNPEVILIGTGSKLVFPPVSSYAPIIKQGIGIEFMDSGAACRTFNILVSEDRSVAAGIIIQDSPQG